MGKASRRKKIDPNKPRATYRAPIPFKERPFEGLAREGELVAMREIIPCATLKAKTNTEHGGLDFHFVTLVPDGHQAMVREDGHILVGLQTRFHTGDLSHDCAAGLLKAIDMVNQDETGIVNVDVRDAAPRLQDLLDPDGFGDIEVVEDFEYWIDPTKERTEDMDRALAQNRDDVVPTAKVPGVHGMFWCSMNRNFVRWVTDVEESALFTALARLQAAGQATMGPDSRFVGAFRACGIAIPVFELAEGATELDIAGDAAVLEQRLQEALTVTEPLSDAERRARQGLISRQVTVR